MIELLQRDEEMARDDSRAAQEIRQAIASIHIQIKKLRRYATFKPELIPMAEVEDVEDHLASFIDKLEGEA